MRDVGCGRAEGWRCEVVRGMGATVSGRPMSTVAVRIRMPDPSAPSRGGQTRLSYSPAFASSQPCSRRRRVPLCRVPLCRAKQKVFIICFCFLFASTSFHRSITGLSPRSDSSAEGVCVPFSTIGKFHCAFVLLNALPTQLSAKASTPLSHCDVADPPPSASCFGTLNAWAMPTTRSTSMIPTCGSTRRMASDVEIRAFAIRRRAVWAWDATRTHLTEPRLA